MAYDLLLEKAKEYTAYVIEKGWVGSSYVMKPSNWLGEEEGYKREWTITAPAPKQATADERASKIWSGMKRTKVLYSANLTEWNTRMGDMVSHGEAESVELLRTLIKSLNRTQLQESKNDHFAIQQIAEVLPANLKIA